MARRGDAKAFRALEPLFAGVDTHKDTHTMVVLDSLGRRVASKTFTADAAGYGELELSLRSAGEVAVVAVEGCGSYGAGLVAHLKERDYLVSEAMRPGQRHASPKGKDDDIDAERAAKRALAEHTSGIGRVPKDTSGVSGELSWLLSARESAARDRSAISCQIHGLLVRAPEDFRSKYRGLTTRETVKALKGLRPRAQEPMKVALRSLARRWLDDDREARELEGAMRAILDESHPALMAAFGVSTLVAATIVVCAGDNPERYGSEAAWAFSCGVCPIPASSGKTSRHRLNRGGDRRANNAIHRIALVRMRHDPATIAYIEKKRAEGKSKMEALRCLKRFIAREVYRLLLDPNAVPAHPGPALRERRVSLGLTQKEVAVALGTYAARVSQFERGLVRYPKLEDAYTSLFSSLALGEPTLKRVKNGGLQT